MEKKINYSNEEITVVWKPDLCWHSTICYTELPEVFNPSLKKWIDVDGAPSEMVMEQVKRCPSGALSFVLKSDKED